MYRFFKFILGTGLVVISLWSCSLDDAAPVLPINLADPIPLAKEFYTQEKPKQVTSSFRIQTEQEIFPFWSGAKSHANGRMLIVPAHRKLQVRYEAGYLRRFVFELDERGQVIRGGMLELAGKDSKFLLQNEELLIEGFLAGVKSKDLTYLWSDFVARPLDGTQADGRVVALQREGGAKSRLDAEALRTEFCIDWYWVYSFNGVVVYEVYSHTTCGSASCDSARTADAQDACLDDGVGAGGDEGQIIYKIENNVKSPCISGQVNKAVDSQFKNQITSLINSAFGESEKFDIILEDNNLNDNSLDGVTGISFTETVMTFTITLNSEVLTSSSQEYILAVVFHELLHAYMGHLGIDKSSISIAAATAGLISVPIAAVGFVFQYALGATATFSISTVLGAMVGTHILIGIGEAIITALTVSAVMASRSDLVFGWENKTSTLEIRN